MPENARTGVKSCVAALSLHKNAAGAKLVNTSLSAGVFEGAPEGFSICPGCFPGKPEEK